MYIWCVGDMVDQGGGASSTEMRARFSNSSPQYFSLACAYLCNITTDYNIFHSCALFLVNITFLESKVRNGKPMSMSKLVYIIYIRRFKYIIKNNVNSSPIFFAKYYKIPIIVLSCKRSQTSNDHLTFYQTGSEICSFCIF